MDISNDAIVLSVRGPAAESAVGIGWRITEVQGFSVQTKDDVVASLHTAGVLVEIGFLKRLNQDRTLCGGMSFCIQPPITIVNCLPTQVTIELEQIDGKHIDGKHEMSPGTDVSIYHSPAGVSMKMTIEGTCGLAFCESGTISLDKPTTVTVLDTQGRPLQIELDNQQVDGKRIVSIYAKVWILNYTGLPLRYGCTPNGLVYYGDTADGILSGVSLDGIFSHRPCMCHHSSIRIQIAGEANFHAAHSEDSEFSSTFNISSIGTTGAIPPCKIHSVYV
jgi:hypothetical protein